MRVLCLINTRRIAVQHSLVASRSLSASSDVRRTTKSRSKKKYGELPTALILQDGTSAQPLGEWTDSSFASNFKNSAGASGNFHFLS